MALQCEPEVRRWDLIGDLSPTVLDVEGVFGGCGRRNLDGDEAVSPSSVLGDERHVGEPFEIRVLCPDGGTKRLSSRIDDAIGQRQGVLDRDPRGEKRKGRIEIDHVALLHCCHSLKCVSLGVFSKYELEDLGEDRWWVR